MSELTKQPATVCIDVGTETDVFRLSAADEILDLLVAAHETEFSIPELVDATGAARSTVWRAVDLLDGLGVVRVRETPQRNYVSIDPERLQKDDPILAIEQTEFHDPIRAFVERVRDAFDASDDINDLVGVVVFGSVARGEADRRSDIDLFVVVDGDRTSARRHTTDVVSELSEERFDGDRFAFEPYVESVDSATRAGSKLREIFDEGITVVSSERLQAIRKAVYSDE
ncbi:nucleotidyltransferase domain-containing protein [Haloarcula laminariae]|uniref:nucleotidyltransferase domain-containing protein n=1 Tax=Haloarcula laminariae TaxID=2961577 RepID=UPI002405EB78|nr:nucleotidyltransferase domain-containing protein [Halomicroarcula sp. FL173]